MKVRQAVQALSALAHENRLGVYRMLVEAGSEGLNAGTISTRLRLPPSSLTFHLQHLHRVGLVTQERNSRQLIYAADFAVMNDLVAYLTENCCGGATVCATGCNTSEQPAKRPKRAAKVA
jgi:DNA-binding transcriptional ArsR family regulator